MGTVGTSLIKDIDVQDIISTLDSFHAYEMVAMHFNFALQNRLAGQALIVLNQELEEKAKEALEHARKLADRIAQLGGAVTGDPSKFVELSHIGRFTLPTDTSGVPEILSYILEQERPAIRAYGEFLGRINDKDIVTYQLGLEILKDKIRTEDEIEAALAK